jgi:hypothetical protein
MPRFLLLFLLWGLPLLPKREEVVNALQTNAHSGAIPNSFSSSESSQLHGGAGLGVLAVVAVVYVVYVVGMAPEGTNTNGETKCLRSAIDCVDVSCIVYYNACIIIRIHVFLCFYLRNFN